MTRKWLFCLVQMNSQHGQEGLSVFNSELIGPFGSIIKVMMTVTSSNSSAGSSYHLLAVHCIYVFNSHKSFAR